MNPLSFIILIGLATIAGEPGTGSTQRNAARAPSITITVSNPTGVARDEEIVPLDLRSMKSGTPDFNCNDFYITASGKEVPSQLVDSGCDGIPDKIFFTTSFSPHEKKKIVIHYAATGTGKRVYPARTQAELGVKTGYSKENGYYVGGRFVDVDSAIVPPDHFAHDALYRIEGPGWESDKIAYRFYLDSRNRTDIFGKKTNRLVLQEIGINDLVSDSKESYTGMLDWGMDIFKVGESLGIGSVAMWHGSHVVTVSDVSRTACRVSGPRPVVSYVCANYNDWKVGEEKYDLFTRYSISAGSRLTKVGVSLTGGTADMCTGLAKHAGCTYMDHLSDSTGGKVGWAYIGLYGKQSLAGDDLGTAIFFRSSDCEKVTEDSLSHIVVLRPAHGRLEYYFAAAWDREPGGIRNISQFKKYLDEELQKLDNPIVVRY